MNTLNQDALAHGAVEPAAVLNGNKFVKREHVFVDGKGCYFPTKEIAIFEGTSPNGVGLWMETVEFNNETWFQAGNTNCFD